MNAHGFWSLLLSPLFVYLNACFQDRCVVALSRLPQPFHLPNKEDTPGVDEAPRMDGSSYDSSDKVLERRVNNLKYLKTFTIIIVTVVSAL